MNSLTESHIRKIVRKVLKESLILEISAEEKSKVMDKSTERVPFNQSLMKQAIEQGREIGMNFKSDNDKYTMPTSKYRIIHPVAMGTDKKGNTIIRGLHITGQSEKEAIRTGVRSAEVEAEKDGINAWRLFKASNIRSMWFTDRFFSDNIPGYNPNDRAMTSRSAVYSPAKAKQYQDSLVAQSKEEPVEPTVEPTMDKDLDQIGYEDQPIQEKKGKVRSFFQKINVYLIVDNKEIKKIVREVLKEEFDGTDLSNIKNEESDSWLKTKLDKTWAGIKNTGKAVGREAKETVAAAKIFVKLLKNKDISTEEVSFLKNQSIDIAKALALIGLQAVPGSSVGIIALEKLAKTKGFTLFPKEQEMPSTNINEDSKNPSDY